MKDLLRLALFVSSLFTVAACSDNPSAPTKDAGPEPGSSGGETDGGSNAIGDGGSCVDGSCDASAICEPGANALVFVSQTAPATITRAASFPASMSFVNCTGSTLAHDEVALVAESSPDDDTWGISQVPLTVDISPGTEFDVAFTMYAPPITGDFPFTWQLMDTSTGAPIGDRTPMRTISVTASPGVVTLCAGQTADASGASSAAAAMQSCIDATPSGGTLEIPDGVYRIDAQLHVTKPISIRTQGLAGSSDTCFTPGVRCATWQADPALDVQLGIVTLGTDASPAHDVTLDHVIIDGNRDARASSAAATQCTLGSNSYGMNATAQCDDCTLTHMASVRALCGTAMGFQGNSPTIVNSDFRSNGQHAPYLLHRFSDGLTLSHGENAVIEGNVFRDNSDVGFVTGGSKNATITGNTIMQRAQGAFAGLMLDNFNGTSSGDFTGTTVSSNSIDCGANLCDYGIELGPHPWYASANLVGGTVTNNTVLTPAQGINAAGAGTSGAPMSVYANTITGNASSGTFTCGVRSTSALNITTDSYVDRHGETSPTATSQSFGGCQ